MAELTIVIKDGKAVVTADGTEASCDAARQIEKALGTVTKSVPTGTSQTAATKIVQR